MSDPQVLILDEPSLGLAPLIVQDLSELLGRILKTGVAVLIVEQNSRLAVDLSDEVVVLQQGSVVAQGPSLELLTSNDDLLGLFLGL